MNRFDFDRFMVELGHALTEEERQYIKIAEEKINQTINRMRQRATFACYGPISSGMHVAWDGKPKTEKDN